MVKIKITVENQEVEGEITRRTRRAIVVKISKPFSNLMAGRYLPAIVPDRCSFEGREADLVCESLLTELYKLGRYLETELSRLRKKFCHVQENLLRLSEQKAQNKFSEQKRALKAKFKQGQFTQTEYQKQFGNVRKLIHEYDQQKVKILEDFLKEGFPMHVPFESREQIFTILSDLGISAAEVPGPFR